MSKNTVIFGGDTGPSKDSIPLFREGNIEALFSDILPVMQEADNVIINLETAVTEKETRIIKCGPNLKLPLQAAKALKAAGVTACGMANNHVYDFGYAGLKDTFRALEEAGLDRFGCGHNEAEACAPYFFSAGDKRVAVIAVGEHEYNYAIGERPGAAPYEPFDTIFRIRDAKAEADYVVVMYHGGKEQCEYPSPRLYRACHAFVDMGADLVLCQHSHIIGTYEQYKDGFILYGQGNFNFINYLDLVGWTTGLMLRVTFEEKMTVEMIPLVTDGSGMRLANAEEKAEILGGLEKRSESLKNGTWMEGWMAFVESKREPYTKVIEDAFGHGDDPFLQDEYFGHYLDCEAHTDVWKSLFPTWHYTGADRGLEED